MTFSNARVPTVVIWSTQIWTDNWVSKHWISVLLAEQGYDVFYVEPLRGVINRGGAFKDIFFGPKIRLEDGVKVVSISTLPAYYRTKGLIRQFFKRVLRSQFVKLNAMLPNDYILLTFDGRSLPFLKMLKAPARSAYYCVDPVGAGAERGYEEGPLTRHVDLNLAISDACADDMKRSLQINHVDVIPHGMLFSERSEMPGLSQRPDHGSREYKGTIGYAGSIHDVYVNYAYILRAMEDLPGYHWCFVGPFSGSAIAQDSSKAVKDLLIRPETSFLGSMPAWELGTYISKFDVCLIPYRNDIPNGWERRSPVKILHYLRLGKPVVCARVPGVSDYAELIYQYSTYAEFLQALKTALIESDENPLPHKRRQYTKTREASVILERLKGALQIPAPGV